MACYNRKRALEPTGSVSSEEDPPGKFLLIITIRNRSTNSRQSCLWARLIGVEPPHRAVLQGMALEPKAPDTWGTMAGDSPCIQPHHSDRAG